MNIRDDKLNPFFGAVTRVIISRIVTNKNALFHDPRPACFDGSCIQAGISAADAYTRKCNWNDLLKLSAWFLIHGPEVDEIWKREAWTGRFNPEDLHDIMLGVLVGGDGNKKETTVNVDYHTASDTFLIDGVPIDPKTALRDDSVKFIFKEPKP